MLFSSIIVAVVAPLLAGAVPVRRQADPTDLLVLKFAGVLERLETAFYTQALAKFQDSDFTSAGFGNVNIPKELFSAILTDESAHTSIIESTIKANGDQPVTTCNFDFSAALKDVATMAATARVVENVGVSAYMGAAPLMVNKELLTAAASILTIEARHQSILNVINGGPAIPQSFDIALSPSQVLALAGPFISGCDLGIPANKPLAITASPAVAPGAFLSFASPGLDGHDSSTLNCQMMVGGAPFAIVLPLSACIVPGGIQGPVYIFVTNDTVPLINSQVNQLTSSILAGPALVFLDTVPSTLSQVARGSSGVVTSTQTITPAEADAIIAAGTTVSSVAAAPTATSTQKSAGVPAEANTFTGTSKDGTLQVVGWTIPQ